ncbi:MAG: thiaminase II [Chloroflexi bacterium]|nr:thiaminase II [Chloroflexota bacterium]MCH8350299.1 thiaminase II [Chloroflexota bacterium]MCI0781106.1 thiaminase II [Chloroflexota bacterium]MCI0785988.1 thiaminase II [Chloroflexota bacterium]MCI0793849.1 thiaminase II [Chloroflexota bacterium]
MSFADDIERRAMPIRQAILAHPFITGIGDGTLPVDKFQHYVKQDYVYLIDYSRVLALASARAPDLESMGWFASLLDEILNTEMELHRSYCAEFGITRDDLEATSPAPTTVGYTSFLLKVAHQGTFGEVVACLLPCLWGYWEIGDHLARRGEPEGAPLYSQWIQMYSSPEYSQLAQQMRDLANRVGQGASPAERVAMADVYLTSIRYEHQFWEMAYSLEEWPV